MPPLHQVKSYLIASFASGWFFCGLLAQSEKATLVFPQIADGGGIQFELSLTNPGYQKDEGAIFFKSSNGQSLTDALHHHGRRRALESKYWVWEAIQRWKDPAFFRKKPLRVSSLRLTIAELGHEEPTLLLTNQLRTSPARLIARYAQRMIIENGIQDGVDFFHMDALSSAVAMKVTCDLQLTLMAGALYRLLGTKVGHGYESAKSRHIFRDLLSGTALVTLTEGEVIVRMHKRAHNPLLIAAGFPGTHAPIPWLGGKPLRLDFGF